jgi:hypothetical protein
MPAAVRPLSGDGANRMCMNRGTAKQLDRARRWKMAGCLRRISPIHENSGSAESAAAGTALEHAVIAPVPCLRWEASKDAEQEANPLLVSHIDFVVQDHHAWLPRPQARERRTPSRGRSSGLRIRRTIFQLPYVLPIPVTGVWLDCGTVGDEFATPQRDANDGPAAVGRFGGSAYWTNAGLVTIPFDSPLPRVGHAPTQLSWSLVQ